MINSEQEVESCMRQLKTKFSLWGIIFLHRDKNVEALKLLGITPQAREEIIKEIDINDYIETIQDAFSFGDMWVFGKDYDGTELYIKISMGSSSNSTICISFHTAEFPLKYAFKK